MQKARNIKQLPVDLKALMEGLSSLVLPSQKVMFSPHMYASLSLIFSLQVTFSIATIMCYAHESNKVSIYIFFILVIMETHNLKIFFWLNHKCNIIICD